MNPDEPFCCIEAFMLLEHLEIIAFLDGSLLFGWMFVTLLSVLVLFELF